MMSLRFSPALVLLLPALVNGLGLYDSDMKTHWWCCTDAFCGQSCCASGKVPADAPPSNTPPAELIENFFNWTATGLEPDHIDPPNDEGFVSNRQVWQIRRYADAYCSDKFQYTCDIHVPPAEPDCSGVGTGDPHFKTWTGQKFDYHGECDLVLVDNPTFNNNQGLRLHIRTKRVSYYSFIERVALQIGDDVLEFANDAENFMVNGTQVPPNRRYRKTKLGGFVVRRDPKALSVRLKDGHGLHGKTGAAKIDLLTRRNGFPAVVVEGGDSDMFKGSLGLLGDWPLGRTMARDGKTQIKVEQYDADEFAQEWQVRDDEPMLFKEARAPQYPQTCVPPKKMMTNRLGMAAARKEAEEACEGWGKDKDNCIFDVIATRDVLVAQEGNIVRVG